MTIAARMPVINDNLPLLEVEDHVVVAYNINLPRIAWRAGLNEAVSLLHPEHEL